MGASSRISLRSNGLRPFCVLPNGSISAAPVGSKSNKFRVTNCQPML